jgi:hypothetical protein
MSSTTELLYQEDGARGDALPAELLPCAAALLLPLLLLPPERVRALDLQRPSRRGGDDRLSVFLSGVLVRPRPPPPRRRPAVLCATAQTAGTQRAPGCAGAQTACRALVADDSTGECRALVPACAGLVPFVVQALRTLADRGARLPGPLRRVAGELLDERGVARVPLHAPSSVPNGSVRAAHVRMLKGGAVRTRGAPAAPVKAARGVRQGAGSQRVPGRGGVRPARGAGDGVSAAQPRAGPAALGAHATGCGAAGGGGGGRPRGGSSRDTSSAEAAGMQARWMAAVVTVEILCVASRALAAALVRAGALGAALRLTQRAVDACAAPERGRTAVLAMYTWDAVLAAVWRHSPAVVRARPAAALPAPPAEVSR